MDTTMPSPRPRSKQRLVRRSSSGTKRPPAQQRTKADSPRALLLGAIGVTAIAAVLDWLVCVSILGEFRRCGHIHIDLMLASMAFLLTIGSVSYFRVWWKARPTVEASTPGLCTKPQT
jgi:hypothetical protein